MWIIKLCIVILMIIAFINTLIRSDFISILVPSVIWVVFYTSFNQDINGYLFKFLLLVSGSVVYDILWLFFSGIVYMVFNVQTYSSGTQYDAGKQNSLKFFVFMTSVLGLLSKITLGFSIWVQRLKHERGLDNPLLNANKSTLSTTNAQI